MGIKLEAIDELEVFFGGDGLGMEESKITRKGWGKDIADLREFACPAVSLK
jgi:hypothetical protein